MHAQQVNVDLNNWSDYVFHENYNLRPLSSVKNYIDQHHHLPEIPSEQEIISKGLDLGKMNKLLMKIVEELTLYLIEKNKEVNNLQEEMSQQQKAN